MPQATARIKREGDPVMGKIVPDVVFPLAPPDDPDPLELAVLLFDPGFDGGGVPSGGFPCSSSQQSTSTMLPLNFNDNG